MAVNYIFKIIKADVKESARDRKYESVEVLIAWFEISMICF